MRLRLVHTLSLWLLATVGASVLAMGEVTAWNLRQGFGAYLQAQDVERLECFVAVAGAQIEKAGGVQALHEHSLTMPMLLREFERPEGHTLSQPAGNLPGAGPGAGPGFNPPPGRGGRGPGDDPRGPSGRPARPGEPGGPGGAGEPGGPGELGPQRPPPPRSPPEAFGSRVALFELDGQPLSGRHLAGAPQDLVERPVFVAGQTLALARMRPIDRVVDGDELRFLRAQYIGIAAVATVLLLAVAAAWWLARQWSRPLAAVQDTTARIARGELDIRLPVNRADEIGDVVPNVNAMAQSLQRIEGSRRRWLADISHELRTPLAGLRGEVEALVDGVAR